MNDHIDIMNNCFYAAKYKDISKEQLGYIYDNIMSDRRLLSIVSNSPVQVFNDLFSIESTKNVILPCDVVELRSILFKNCILSNPNAVLWSFNFANKYLARYPIFITIDKTKIMKPLFSVGSFAVYPYALDIENAIVRITVNQPTNRNIDLKVKRIMSDLGSKIEFGVSNHLPGLSVTASSKIQLTSLEKSIFDLVNAVAKPMGVETRVAGGWTRDKILGISSDDIDISISKMSGYKFAQLVENYAQQNNIQGVGRSYQVSLEKSSEPTSKDTLSDEMMVGGIDIFGQKIEFVPMRTEKYIEGSRMPIAVRTDDVKEDVKRRDLTINAMYFNTQDGQIEDYVGGREDLANKYLRTPVDPVRTFLDDPLRMLRVVRFMTKYEGSKVDPKIIEAMSSPEIHQAYNKKVHPSRASKELRKIFGSKDAVSGARMLFATGMYKPVFQIPETWHPATVDQQNPHHKLNLMEHTLEVMSNYNKLTKDSDMPDNERMLMNMSTFAHDLLKMHPDIRKPKTDKDGKPIMFQRGDQSFEHMQYLEHDTQGSDFITKIMTKMGFTPQEKGFVSQIVKHHMTPHDFEKRMRPEDMGKFLFATDNLYRNVMEHAHADALSKGEMMGEEQSTISQDRIRHLQDINKYREELGDMVRKPVINGERLKELAFQIDPDMVAKGAMIKTNKNPKPIHYISYMNERLLEWQWARKIKSPEDAEPLLLQALRQFSILWRDQNGLPQIGGRRDKSENILDGALVNKLVRKNIPEIHPKTGFMKDVFQYITESGVTDPSQIEQKVLEWKNLNLSKYQQPSTNPGSTKAMNWYKKTKTGQSSSNGDTGGYDGYHSYEGGTAIDSEKDITRYPLMREQKRPEKAEKTVDNSFIEEINGVSYMKYHNSGEKDSGPAFEKDKASGETSFNHVIKIPFQNGDILRRRSKSIGDAQSKGRVIDDGRNDSILKIKWDGKKEIDEIPLNETSFLAHEIEKA